MNTLPSSITILYATYSIMPQCYKNCAISVATHSLTVYFYRLEQDVTWHQKYLKEPSASQGSHFCTLICMPLLWFFGSWCPDVLLLMVSKSMNTVPVYFSDGSSSSRIITLINPLHHNISIDFLQTLLHAFPLVLTRKIREAIKASWVGDHFSYCHDDIKWCGSIAVRRN